MQTLASQPYIFLCTALFLVQKNRVHLDHANAGRQWVVCNAQPLAQRGNQRLCAAVAWLGFAVQVCADRKERRLPAQPRLVRATPRCLLRRKQAGRVPGQSCHPERACSATWFLPDVPYGPLSAMRCTGSAALPWH